MFYEFNDAKFPLDMTDVDTVERYEDAAQKLSDTSKRAPKDGRKSEMLRFLLTAYDTFFNELFGDGASKELFGETKSVALREDAYTSMLDFIVQQNTERNALRSKYSPNRAQRRAKG